MYHGGDGWLQGENATLNKTLNKIQLHDGNDDDDGGGGCDGSGGGGGGSDGDDDDQSGVRVGSYNHLYHP